MRSIMHIRSGKKILNLVTEFPSVMRREPGVPDWLVILMDGDTAKLMRTVVLLRNEEAVAAARSAGKVGSADLNHSPSSHWPSAIIGEKVNPLEVSPTIHHPVIPHP